MGPSPSVTPHLFRCDLAKGAMLMFDSKDSKVNMESSWIWCYLFLVMKSWSNPSVGGSEGDTNSTGSLQISPCASFQHGMAEEKRAVVLHEVCFP